LSAYSSELVILCAFVPEKPTAPVTSIVADNAVVTWSAPLDNGSEITSYTVTIRSSVDTYLEETVNCDGQTSSIVDA
jgi:hypothetical protein